MHSHVCRPLAPNALNWQGESNQYPDIVKSRLVNTIKYDEAITEAMTVGSLRSMLEGRLYV